METKKCVCGEYMQAAEWKHQWVCHRCGRTKPLWSELQQSFPEADDYIERRDAINTIMEKPDLTEDEKAALLRRLWAVPAAAVAPVLSSGVWERVPGREGGFDFRCSACHRFRFHNGELRRYKFCPNCGHPMTGEDEA